MSNLWELIKELKEKIFQREKVEEKPERSEEFRESLQFVLKWEGFISNDPHDPGGLTIWGISYKSHPKEVLEMERLINAVKKQEAFAIAEKIYYENYWLKIESDKEKFPWNLILFDTAVNCGVSRACKLWLETITWQEYLIGRIEFYAGLPTAKDFLRGWVNRVIDLYKFVKDHEQ